jgi:hypothetical protein
MPKSPRADLAAPLYPSDNFAPFDQPGDSSYCLFAGIARIIVVLDKWEIRNVEVWQAEPSA